VVPVPGPLAKLTSNLSSYLRAEDAGCSESKSSSQPNQPVSVASETSRYFGETLPCVLYECNAAFEFTYVSDNISELLGIESNELIGKRLLLDQRIPAEDIIRLSSRLAELEQFNRKTSLIHRILDKRGLPFWVANSFWKANLQNTTVLRGCVVLLDYHGLLISAEQATISRFVHKMGNHFQLLNLVVNSLKRTVSESKETLMLQETVEKAIELTRGFSDYNQVPTCFSPVGLMDIFQGVVMTRRTSFDKKGVTFDSQIHPSVDGAVIQGDPYLLELALGNVLQNALEATETSGQVTLQASVKRAGDSSSVATILVVDSGCGIDESAMPNVTAPFFSSKKNHDGLGLSMASRFVEMHAGILRITSTLGKGTRVSIVLPIEAEGSSRLL